MIVSVLNKPANWLIQNKISTFIVNKNNSWLQPYSLQPITLYPGTSTKTTECDRKICEIKVWTSHSYSPAFTAVQRRMLLFTSKNSLMMKKHLCRRSLNRSFQIACYSPFRLFSPPVCPIPDTTKSTSQPWDPFDIGLDVTGHEILPWKTWIGFICPNMMKVLCWTSCNTWGQTWRWKETVCGPQLGFQNYPPRGAFTVNSAKSLRLSPPVSRSQAPRQEEMTGEVEENHRQSAETPRRCVSHCFSFFFDKTTAVIDVQGMKLDQKVQLNQTRHAIRYLHRMWMILNSQKTSFP